MTTSLMHASQQNQPLISWRWLSLALLVLCIIAFASASTSWLRISPDRQLQISQLQYFLNVGISYCSWLVIAVFANWMRLRIPLFSEKHPKWLLIHCSVAALISLLHILFDTFMLGLLFSFDFNFVSAFAKKVAFWLPVEMLAYLACVVSLSLLEQHKKNLKLPESEQSYTFEQGNQVRVVDRQDIEYIEAYDNYVFVHCANERLMLKQSLSSLAAKLPDEFCRVHRSYLVNLMAVECFESHSDGQAFSRLKSGKCVPVSRRRKMAVKSSLAALHTHIH